MIHVQLQKFEGPLDLLLYLIRKEEMDIFDINIHEITKQYLNYVQMMKELDLEVAGNFIVMASTLIQIKAKMLLPQYNEQGEEVQEEDPRKELIQKLIEYQKYQEVAKALNDHSLLGRDVWRSQGCSEEIPQGEDAILIEEGGLFALMAHYRKIVRSIKKRVHEVSVKTQSVGSRILEIKDKLFVGRQVTMSSLITSSIETQMVRQRLITFLSLLELGRLQVVKLFQSGVYQEIYIEGQKTVESDIIHHVRDFENDSQN